MFRYLEYTSSPNHIFRISGAGAGEEMPPSIVNRPGGTKDRLLMFFYDPVELEVNGEIHECPANTLMLWDNCASHYYGNKNVKWSHSWLHFQGVEAERLLGEYNIQANSPLVFSSPEILEHYLYDIYLEITEYGNDEIILRNHLHNLIRKLSYLLSSSEKDDRIPDPVLKARRFMEENLDKKLSLKTLAKKMNISVPHLSFLFRKHLKVSPIEYHLRKRMEMACYLLKDHNLQVGEIAEKAGYPDLFQFSRAFKKRFGVSPNKYRQDRLLVEK